MKPRSALKSLAQELRNNGTDAERLLWRHLRNSRLEGTKFRRQQPIESYIVDFVSFEQRVIVELDGGQHAENAEYDRQRDACLMANGFKVLRFWNNDVMNDVESVLEVIRERCVGSSLPHPLTPSR